MTSKRCCEDFGPEYELVIDGQDIDSILVSVNARSEYPRATGVFALVGDSDFLEVWATDYRAPYLLDAVYNLVWEVGDV